MFNKRHPEVGARPGTLVNSAEAADSKIRLISFTPDELIESDADSVAQLQIALAPETVTWVDIQGFGNLPLIQQVGDFFNLHPLLLEDVVNIPQRPKAEIYADQILIVVRMVRLSDSGSMDMEQVSIVLADNYVLTFQERYGDILDPVRRRIRTPNARIRKSKADYLAYAIADTIVDGYYPILESVGDRLEQMESSIIGNPTPELLRQLNATKNQLVNLRRGIWPQREAINSLIRGDHPAVSQPVQVFLRDTYDHCVQTSEVVEMYREMATGLMSIYLSSVANRANETMRVLTIMASIFIPLTFLAGIYGMNFKHMPELEEKWAYPTVWATMLLTAGGMLGYFWGKGWIGRGS